MIIYNEDGSIGAVLQDPSSGWSLYFGEAFETVELFIETSPIKSCQDTLTPEGGGTGRVTECWISEEEVQRMVRTCLDAFKIGSCKLSTLVGPRGRNRQVEEEPLPPNGKFDDKSSGMRSQIDFMRTCFEMEEARVSDLLREAVNLRREILDCNFLDELIVLLQGRPENIRSKGWPFRITGGGSLLHHENLVI